MSAFSWPSGSDLPSSEEVRRAWEVTVAALPVGGRVAGRVIGRQPFGVFIRIGGVPCGVGLAEITAMPLGMELPALGAAVAGEVIWHVDHNCQVKIKLDEWMADGSE